VFGGDSAVLRPEGQRILRALAPTLVAVPNSIEVSGHTNQLNVPTRNYPSSWELSTARASSVVRYMLGWRIEASRMTAAGYADQRPLYSPTDPRAVTMNRRVEVVVLSDQPAEVRALLEAAAKGK
jgi:chemotaxis protein MotB